MSVTRRRAKAAKRAAEYAKRNRSTKHPLCPNGCGEPGPHYVPPCLGDPGFFMCTPLIAPARNDR